jgi:quercetin dioxygenase-like cupin family protein
MQVLPSASIPARRGQANYFTGEVWQEVLAVGGEAGVWTLRVSFPPKARTAWHTHPLGQILLVTSGRGYVQKQGQPRQPISTGDVVVIEAGENHWHGAAEDSPLQHIAIQTAVAGQTATWGDLVTDADYAS